MYGKFLPQKQSARWILAALTWVPVVGLPLWGQAQQSPTAVSQADAAAETPVPQEAPSPPKTGTVSGTVTDKDGAFIPKAKIKLTVMGSRSRETLSDTDGHFTFVGVQPGPFDVEIIATGFATQIKSEVLEPGQDHLLPVIQMVVSTEVDVEVTVKTEEIAEEQIHVEETQRVFGIVPNFYVTYVPDAAPLNARQKLELAWKSSIDPVSFGMAAAIAGIEQADGAFSGYGQGAQGFAKRFGASFADITIGTYVGSAILPVVLKQDPRYFYKGTGSRKSRTLYALASAFVCKGDNGRWQPNYSNMLGSLAAGGISNLYYPASNRNGVGLTFENGLIGIGGTAVAGVIQEFFLRRVTPHADHR
jgi:hypothetical protein